MLLSINLEVFGVYGQKAGFIQGTLSRLHPETRYHDVQIRLPRALAPCAAFNL